MINTLLGMSLAGSAVLLVWRLADAVRGDRLPARWHYRILKASLFFMLVPVGRTAAWLGRLLSAAAAAPVSAPAAPSAVPHAPAVAVLPSPVPAAEPLPEAAVSLSIDAFRLLAVLWALGAAAMLSYKLYVCIRFRRRVLRQSRAAAPEALEIFQACREQLGVRGSVRVLENPLLQTSLVTGLLHPAVILPVSPLSPQELRYLFLHELTHIKNRDLWVRFCSLLALCVHWYNPFMHLLNRKIKEASEQSCDEQVSAPLSGGERYAYGSVILKLASAVVYPGEWTAPLSEKESIKRRLICVLHPKHLTKPQKYLSLALAAAILVCGTAAALAARNPLGQKETDPTQNVQAENTHLRETLADWESQKEAAARASAVWFTPEDIHDITSAELVWWDGTSYPLLDPAAPDVLETLLGGASQVQSAGGSFHSVLYLTRADGTVGKLQPAGDSSTVFLSDGVYYDFGGTDSSALYTLFGVSTADLPQWSAAGAIGQLTGSLTYRDGVFSFTIPNGPGAWTIHIAGRLDDGGGMSVHYLDGETWTPGTTYAFQPDGGAYTELAMDIALDGQEATVDLLPYLREPAVESDEPETAAALYPDAVRGDTALILSRGGTLLPDDDPGSYNRIDGVWYKLYLTKSTIPEEYNPLPGGIVSEEYLVGNADAVPEKYRYLLDDLVDGDYPKNSRGESYGQGLIWEYVGYRPDLVAGYQGINGKSGYISELDEAKLPHNLPADQCPHEFLIPLYDSEHNEIDKFPIGCGGHLDPAATGMTIEEAKEAVANAGASLYPDAVRGDTALILSRGGTLLPDDDESAFIILNGTPYKCYESKPCVGEKRGAIYFEYRVGNKELLDDYQLSLLDTLVNDEFPKNSKGSSYGFDALGEYVGYSPDLHRASGTKGEIGYVKNSDVFALPKYTADECPHEFTVPLYDSEENIIGEFPVSCGGHLDPAATGMTIDEAKAAIANGAV